MDSNQIVAVVSCLTGLAAALSPVLSALIAHRQAVKDREFEFTTRREAETKEQFLSAAANYLHAGAGGADYSRLLDAYGNVSFYVSENTRQLMYQLCKDEASDKNLQQKRQQYEQIVQALQKEPPRILKRRHG